MTDIFENAKDPKWLAERYKATREATQRRNSREDPAAGPTGVDEARTGYEAAMRILSGEDPDKVIREAYEKGLPNAPAIEHFGNTLAGRPGR